MRLPLSPSCENTGIECFSLLFYWMIFPIEYSQGNIHYDFFDQYTRNDKELLDKLYYDELDIEMEKLEQITKEDIGEIARKEEAIKNMLPTLQMFMKNIQEKLSSLQIELRQLFDQIIQEKGKGGDVKKLTDNIKREK